MAAPQASKRIALVTGAGSGIGRQITLALLREAGFAPAAVHSLAPAPQQLIVAAT